MRALFAALAACVLLSGCVQAGIDAIEESREERREREQGSTPDWPEPGSHARYVVESWTDDARAIRVWANWTYTAAGWTGACEGAGDAVRYGGTDDRSPPFNTRAPEAVGGDVRAWYLRGCELVERTAAYDGVAQGRHSASSAWPRFFDTEWDERTGLVLGWDLHDASGGSFGRLASTDAPLGSVPGYVAPHG